MGPNLIHRSVYPFPFKMANDVGLVPDFLQKVQRLGRDFIHFCLQREMPRVQELHFRLGQILLERVCSRRYEGRVAFAPDGQQGHLRLAEVGLEFGILGHVCAVVVEEGQLAVLIGGGLHVGEVVVCVGGPVDEGQVGGRDAGSVLVFGCAEGQDARANDFVVLGRGVGPEGFDGVPEWVAEPFDVGVAVLGYDCSDAGWVGEGETQTDGSAVVEYVDGVGADVEGGEECLGREG